MIIGVLLVNISLSLMPNGSFVRKLMNTSSKGIKVGMSPMPENSNNLVRGIKKINGISQLKPFLHDGISILYFIKHCKIM